MERQSKGLLVIVAVLAVAVLAMSVGFAALSQTLKIDGEVKVDPQNWKVQFVEGSTDVSGTTVSANNKKFKADNVTPITADDILSSSDVTVTGTSVTFDAHLQQIGDVADFTVDVENAGDIDAVLKALTFNAPTEEYIKTTFAYDGTTYSESAADLSLALNTGDKKTVHVRLEYVMPTTEAGLATLPTGTAHEDDVTVKFSATLDYQAK